MADKKVKKGIFAMIKESFKQEGCGCAGGCCSSNSSTEDKNSTAKNNDKSK